MKEDGLQARRDRRFKVTTRSVSGRRVASNRLNQEFSVSHLDTVWAGDITYLWTREGWLYLAVLLDLCSRRVVGWSCSDRLRACEEIEDPEVDCRSCPEKIPARS